VVHLLAYESVFGSYDAGKRPYRGSMVARATSGPFSGIEIIKDLLARVTQF
jgi:hypothetical protein